METAVWAFFSAIFGSLSGPFLTELLSHFSKRGAASEKHRDDIIKEICDTIVSLRGDADRYWIATAEELGPDDRLLFAHITAKNRYVMALYSELFSGQAKRDCDVLFTDFQDDIAGGDFGNTDRIAHPERLTSVHTNGLQMMHLVSKLRSDLPFSWKSIGR